MRIFSIGGRRVDRDPMVDIDRLLVEYAWTEIADTNIFDRIFKKKKFLIEVNWSYLDITHQLTSFRLRNLSGGDPSSASQLQTNKKDKSSLEKLKKKVVQRDLCLFRTEFTNSSDESQTFTFKTERKTTSRCDINIQRGFRIGGNVDVRVSIPTSPAGALPKLDQGGVDLDTCRITGGLSGELHVTKATGQTIEENLTWGVDSQVNVEAKSRVVAALMIREEELVADFIITTTIRAVDSVIPVYVKNKKTNRVLELLEIPADNLADILGSDKGFLKVDENVVQCQTKGNMRAVYGAEQVIRVDSYKDVNDDRSNKYDPTFHSLGAGECLVQEA